VKRLFICLLIASLAAFAIPNGAAADCTGRAKLSATSDGEAFAASGLATVRLIEADAQQTFAVHVKLEVPDGTQLSVFTNGQPVGTITVALGLGMLNLSVPVTADDESVCSIGPVWVTDAGQTTTFLMGSF